MRVVSGIGVSFDGKTSRYLPLPPLLPNRPAAWQPRSASACAVVKPPPANRGARSSSHGGGGSGGDRGVGAGGVSAGWEALPGEALETIALFVSFHSHLGVILVCCLEREYCT